MNTKEVASMTNISVRALHHYDEIGLLCPTRNGENGYREYSEEDLDCLQQILFFKECGFSLAKIRQLMSSPAFDRKEAFQLQKKYLLHEKMRIDAMLETLNKSLKSMEGEYHMAQQEKFGGFDMSNNPYEEEARQRWGDDAVNASTNYINSLSKEGQRAIAQGMGDLFAELATIRTCDPASEQAQNAIARMYKYFNTNFGYHYTLEAFAGLGQMYVDDERFTRNIDQFGAGLSEFLSEAMAVYAQMKSV